MTTTMVPRAAGADATLSAIGGAELNELLAVYLSKLYEASSNDFDGPIGADEVLVEILQPELDQLSCLDEVSLGIVVMYAIDCAIGSSAAAMNLPPIEAAAEVAENVAKLRKRLQEYIAEGSGG